MFAWICVNLVVPEVASFGCLVGSLLRDLVVLGVVGVVYFLLRF